jgi:hypothetical protein
VLEINRVDNYWKRRYVILGVPGTMTEWNGYVTEWKWFAIAFQPTWTITKILNNGVS